MILCCSILQLMSSCKGRWMLSAQLNSEMWKVLCAHWKDWCWSWNSNTLGLLMQRADSFGKDPDAGKNWGQEEKGMTEDEMVGWNHRLNGRGFGWTPGVGDGQGGLVWCGSWGRKESDMTERLNWLTELSLVSEVILYKPTYPVMREKILSSIVLKDPFHIWTELKILQKSVSNWI